MLPFIQSAARFPTGPTTLADICAELAGDAAFVLCQGGVPIFGYTLARDGADIIITCAAGRSSLDLTAGGLAMIERQVQGRAAGLTFHTVRRGLVRKAARAGYVQHLSCNPKVYIMRKKL